ncbi:chymotrypsin-2-like [Armigeres subalbatus]|uniref:chymotrypsin-2-like n=1 Tax=Armigeres subalbatus TaxID=124917 RepID=UPI002ED57E9B
MKVFVLLVAALVGFAQAVVDGEFAEKGQFPYQVALTKKGKLHCGGVLVHERFVLTAANCLFDGENQVSEKALRVFFGSERLSLGGQYRNVKSFKVHEQFDRGTFRYDLALLELSKPAKLSESVAAAAVYGTSFTSDELVTFSGWGRTADNENTVYKLKYNTLTALTSEECESYLGEAFYEGALCFRSTEGTGSACFGDYGGPAVVENTVVGVASYTFGGTCGNESPDVFVDAGFFHDWVEQNLAN